MPDTLAPDIIEDKPDFFDCARIIAREEAEIDRTDPEYAYRNLLLGHVREGFAIIRRKEKDSARVWGDYSTRFFGKAGETTSSTAQKLYRELPAEDPIEPDNDPLNTIDSQVETDHCAISAADDDPEKDLCPMPLPKHAYSELQEAGAELPGATRKTI